MGVLAPLPFPHPIWGQWGPWGEISADATTKESASSGPQLFHRFQFSRRPNQDPRHAGPTHLAARALAPVSKPFYAQKLIDELCCTSKELIKELASCSTCTSKTRR